jgi:hypothetical protein
MSLLREAALEMAQRIRKGRVPKRHNGELRRADENFDEVLAFNEV